jgi:hypothetical protein
MIPMRPSLDLTPEILRAPIGIGALLVGREASDRRVRNLDSLQQGDKGVVKNTCG